MQRSKTVLLLVLLLLLIAVSGIILQLRSRAIAQSEPTPSSIAATNQLVAPDTIFTNTIDSERQRELETLYQALIEDYSVKARQFSLNRAQWQSIQTLRSLEEAVMATAVVLVARDKALITYLELLLVVLEKTPGIELSLKQTSQNSITNRIEWLRQHELITQRSADRDSVNLRADEFMLEVEPMLAEARTALMLIRLGQLQTTFDRTNGLYQRILDRNTANPGTAIQEVERARAYAQVDIHRDEIQYQLRLARESLDERTAERGRVEESYSAFISALEVPYAQTAKYLSFLEELARDIW